MALSTSPNIHQALALVAKAVTDGSLPVLLDGSGETPWGDKEATPLARMDAESGEVLGEAALAVAFGAFVVRGGGGGPIHTLVASIGLIAMLAGEEPARRRRSPRYSQTETRWRPRSTGPGIWQTKSFVRRAPAMTRSRRLRRALSVPPSLSQAVRFRRVRMDKRRCGCGPHAT